MRTIRSIWLLTLVAASACVFPERHRLPEMHVQLVDGSFAVHEAKVGYSWRWGQEACDQSINVIHADDHGQFVLPAQSSWGMGFIVPIPDFGRPGWQLCFKTPTGERRYFSLWAEPNETTTVRCDLGRAKPLDVCEVLSER
jgi:hypothetical protein